MACPSSSRQPAFLHDRMTSLLRHCLAVSLLVSMARCGSNDDRRRMEQLQQQHRRIHSNNHHHHQQHQQQQQQRQLYTGVPPNYPSSSRHTQNHHQSSHLVQLPIRVSTASAPVRSLDRIFSPSNENFRFLKQPQHQQPSREFFYTLSRPRDKNVQRISRTIRQLSLPAHLFYQSGFPIPAKSRRIPNILHTPHRQGFNTNLHHYRNTNDKINQRPYPVEQQPRSKVFLKDEPSQSDYGQTVPANPNPPSADNSGAVSAFLDPANFKLQDMDLSELQAAVDLIDSHIRVKDNDPSAYTGSRVLVLLLREQCFRLQASGDPDIDVFCQRFNNRFRSMLF